MRDEGKPFPKSPYTKECVCGHPRGEHAHHSARNPGKQKCGHIDCECRDYERAA